MAATLTKKANALDHIDAMIASLAADAEKRASESHTEPGGYSGPTQHPVKNVEDHTQEEFTGERARENEEDVKEDQGATAVDGEDVNTSKSSADATDQDSVQLNIGTKQRATGEDPENETGKAKAGKDDPAGQGTTLGQSSHPARTNNDELDGRKYAAHISQLRQQVKTAQDLGNDYVASVAVASDSRIRSKAAEINPEAVKKAMACSTCGKDPCSCAGKSAAAAAGAALADSVLGSVDSTDKTAEAAQVVEDIRDTIVMAYKAAMATSELCNGIRAAEAEQKKKAAAAKRQPVRKRAEGLPPEMGAGGGPEGGGGPDEQALLAALAGEGGGEGGEGGGMPPGAEGEMGGEPGGGMMGGEMGGEPGGGMMGGEPGGEMGGEPGGGMMGGEPGGEPDQELLMLAAALQEAGVTPQQIEAAHLAKGAQALQKKASTKAAPVAAHASWRPKNAAEQARYQAVLNAVKDLTGAA